MKDVASTIIRSYERDIKSGVAVSAVRRHAIRRAAQFSRSDRPEIGDKLLVWINSSL